MKTRYIICDDKGNYVTAKASYQEAFAFIYSREVCGRWQIKKTVWKHS